MSVLAKASTANFSSSPLFTLFSNGREAFKAKKTGDPSEDRRRLYALHALAVYTARFLL
jgi:hypothetical protein